MEKTLNRRNFAKQICALCAATAFLAGCSSPNDNAASAQQVAERWVSQNIDQIAGTMAGAVASDYSALVKPVISIAMKSGMNYRYRPSKIKTDSWRVTVEASNSIDLSKIGVMKLASAKGEIDLVVDTKNLNVRDYTFNASSVEVKLTDK